MLADRRKVVCVVAEDPTDPRPVPGGAAPGGPLDAAGERSATDAGAVPAAAGTGGVADAVVASAGDSAPRRIRRGSGRDPLEAAVDAELAKRRRVVAVRLSEIEHIAWRREAAADKRGQLGAWTRSVVAAEITRRQGADVPDTTTTENTTGGGAVVVLNESVVRELGQQLIRVGNLLNQVTRLAHTEARPGGVDGSTMAQVVSGIDQTRATIAALDGRLEEMSRR